MSEQFYFPYLGLDCYQHTRLQEYPAIYEDILKTCESPSAVACYYSLHARHYETKSEDEWEPFTDCVDEIPHMGCDTVFDEVVYINMFKCYCTTDGCNINHKTAALGNLRYVHKSM